MTSTATAPDANVLPLSLKPSASVVMVDPETARRWLGRNTHNRRIRLRVVAAYARDMSAGNWHITGEAIKFDNNNVLLDGQHRLLAVIEADACVAMFVVRGLRPETQDVMDTGSRRQAGDVLTLNGYSNASLLASTAKWAVLWDEDRLYTDRASRNVTHSQIVEYVCENDELHQAIATISSLQKHVDLQPSILALALYLTSRVSAPESLEFFARVADGINLTEGSPILALRSRLRQIRNDRSRVEPEALLSITLRAWNAHREGRRMASIPIYRGKSAIRCPMPK